MKLNQIDGIVHYLITIGPPKSRAFELDNKEHAVREKKTVHAKSSSTKIEFEDDVSNRLIAGLLERAPQNWQPISNVLLEHLHALAPFLILILLDFEIGFGGSPCELIGNLVSRCCEKGLTRTVIPGSRMHGRGSLRHNQTSPYDWRWRQRSAGEVGMARLPKPAGGAGELGAGPFCHDSGKGSSVG